MTIDAATRYLSLHSLTTFAHVLLVRDDAGEPKTSTYGDAERVILSPQSQRRADRIHLRDEANLGTGPLAAHAWGVRTREWAVRVAEALRDEHGWEAQAALEMARTSLRGVGLNFGSTPNTAFLTKVMVFAPEKTGSTLAQIIQEHRPELEAWATAVADAATAAAEAKSKGKKKGKGKAAATADEAMDGEADSPEAEGEASAREEKVAPMPARIKSRLICGLAPADAIDIALYGRFLAEVASAGNVDGAIQTTTALSVEPASIVRDFFSAADDFKIARQRVGTDFTDALARLNAAAPFDAAAPEASDGYALDDRGAGMTGHQNFFNGTFYAHSVLDRVQLRRNLINGGMSPEDAERAAQDAELALVTAFVNAVPSAKKNTTAAPGTLPKLVLAHVGPRPYNYAAVFEKAIHRHEGVPSLIAAERLLEHHAMITRKQHVDPGTVLSYDIATTKYLDGLRDAGNLGPTEVDHPAELSPYCPAGQPA
ncbi:type I-E CRISPR-associated protein Cas7/Cse4/CasC [Streptomyces sp. MB09-01]|uniref:type I-E CRISPR-associated protein Cas7/Cse4/CasC n=1 Tax=Streptomyces sp. MB09-01 TaxID=3028666 RepID=UPI0029A46B12|nr:type I-E CRISPR-associated protein Cas7/Cse4/CasC [Streptomyces sp. MB09-01]MDX3540590.1 type I-E CRISPR-associated protein Cas7/Cse4/CasC [Streptomyces sp. MB09-01]